MTFSKMMFASTTKSIHRGMHDEIRKDRGNMRGANIYLSNDLADHVKGKFDNQGKVREI